MRKVASLVLLVFAGCVSTATFNKTVSGLKAEARAENAFLRRQVKEEKDFLSDRMLVQDKNTREVLGLMRFLFDKIDKVDFQLFTHAAGIEQASKDLADLDEKVEMLGKKLKDVIRDHKDLSGDYKVVKRTLLLPSLASFTDIKILREMLLRHLREHLGK